MKTQLLIQLAPRHERANLAARQSHLLGQFKQRHTTNAQSCLIGFCAGVALTILTAAFVTWLTR